MSMRTVWVYHAPSYRDDPIRVYESEAEAHNAIADIARGTLDESDLEGADNDADVVAIFFESYETTSTLTEHTISTSG